MAVRREHTKQLNDLKTGHTAELIALRQQLTAAHYAVMERQAVIEACHRRLQEREAALQDLQVRHESVQAENSALRERLRACDNVNRLIAEVARGDPSVLMRGS
jgi:hypothetical protein